MTGTPLQTTLLFVISVSFSAAAILLIICMFRAARNELGRAKNAIAHRAYSSSAPPRHLRNGKLLLIAAALGGVGFLVSFLAQLT